MPEGDTLELHARRLAGVLEGRICEGLEFPRLAHDVAPFRGSTIQRVEARGKYLCIHFSTGRVLVTHLGMTGRWGVVPASRPWRGRAGVVAIVRTAEHEAVCTKAPRVKLVEASRLRFEPGVGTIGPDLLGETFDAAEAARRVRSRPVPIAVALMDQRAVAGIGNVWKSEILFAEAIDPRAPAASIDEARLTGILERLRVMMQRVVETRGPRTTHPFLRAGERALDVYRRAGEACPRCGGRIERIRQGEPARSTYLCPRCQGSG